MPGPGKINGSLKGHNDGINTACLSPDGRYFATASWDSTVKIWDTNKGTLVTNLKGHMDAVNYACFSPDGRQIATASRDSSIKIWEVPDGKLIRTLNGHKDNVERVQYSRDNKLVLSASDDGTAKLWQAETGKLMANLEGHEGEVKSANFSPDGKKIVTASWDNTIKLWDAATGNLVYTCFTLDSTDYFVQVPSAYYFCTPGASKLLHYTNRDLKVITFEQLDLIYNRPDLVLEAMGSPDTSLIRLYRKAWQKRVLRLGFDTALFRGAPVVPEADFQDRDKINYEQSSTGLALHVRAKDETMALDRFNIWINEVPLFGVKGISLKGRNKKTFDTTLTVTLSAGENRVETSVTNQGGLESYRVPLDVNCTAPAAAIEKVYFVGIGIERFKDSRYNLQWSVKDIRDLAQVFKKRYAAAITIDTPFR
jgi:WD40 repeat protein